MRGSSGPSRAWAWAIASFVWLAAATSVTSLLPGGESIGHAPGGEAQPAIGEAAGPLAPLDAYVDISVVPGSTTVVLGTSFTVEVRIDPNDQPVDAVDADITYDPSVLQVQSIAGLEELFAYLREQINVAPPSEWCPLYQPAHQQESQARWVERERFVLA